jgi:nitroreductase
MAPFIELVRKRRSVRKYQPKPVDREKIDQCIEAARLAPSAENVQPWRFIIIDNKQKIADFSKAAFGGIYRFSKFVENAAAIVVIAAQPDILANKLGTRIQGTQYYLLDIGIAGEHFVLQAAELGIGTCWIGWFNPKKAHKHLSLPRNPKVAALIAIGYTAHHQTPTRKRKTIDQIRRYLD